MSSTVVNQSQQASNKTNDTAAFKLITALVLGIYFGIILTKGEVISWFRIQEMFRFDSFHMYGVIGSAIVVGIISISIIRKLNVKSLDGSDISLKPKKFHTGTLVGGIIFGLGWALTGACPGPLYALLGNGYTVYLIPLTTAIMGTWVYGRLREKLPH